MPVAVPKDLQNLVDDIEEYQSLFQNDRLQRQIIDFVRSLHALEEPTSTETIKGLATQIKGDLHPIQIDALTLFLKKAIRINNIIVRVNTVKLLGYLGDSARSAIPELIELIELEANQESVRIYTSQALASIGLFKYQDAQQLIRYIKSPNPQIQENIIAAIAKLRQKAAPLIPELQRVLSTEEPSKPDENVTMAIISCFGEMGEKANQIAPLLSDYLRPEKSIAIRSATARALARIGQIPQKAISELIAGLDALDKLAPNKEEDDLRRIAFVDALAQSSLEIDKIVGELSRFSGDEALEHYIIRALARINSVSSVKSLTELLLLQDDPDVAISNALHQIDLEGKWEAKSDIILSILNQRVPPPLSNKDGLFLHLFYGMLPPSKAKSISDDWDRAETENLCQILVDKTLEYQTKSDLFETILQIVSVVTSRRLKQSESVLKQKINKYKASHKQLLENLQKLKSSLQDESTSQIADKLIDKVAQSVKRPPVLSRLGRRRIFEPVALGGLIIASVITNSDLNSESQHRVNEELKRRSQ